MKLISTIYTGNDIEITLIVQSRASRRGETNESLVVRYKSRVGKQSLIFNPTIALVLRNRGQSDPSAWVPSNLIYRFTSMLSNSYQGLGTDKLYYMDHGAMYIDRKLAEAQTRKISLFRNTLVLSPGIVYDREEKPAKALVFAVDGEVIGLMSHTEVMSLIELLDHFDINTFSLLAGVVDELESLHGKVDTLIMSSRRIEELLTTNQNTQSTTEQPLNWKYVQNRMF